MDSLAVSGWFLLRNSFWLRRAENRLLSVGSVCGQLVVSAANGKIKDVVKQGDNYRIVFEQESGFVAAPGGKQVVVRGQRLVPASYDVRKGSAFRL